MEELRKELSNILKEALLDESFSSQDSSSERHAKPKAVRFNPGLETEYIVTFSERGFLLGDTRLSFEEIQNALSKEYTITLKDNTLIDAVKMQQILKYKDMY